MLADWATNLANHFLIAMPQMVDPNFEGALILIAEHSAEGAMGLVVNRPMTMTLAGLFERIDLELVDPVLAAQPVLAGGPVQADRGFVLHRPATSYTASCAIGGSMALTSSRDVLEAVAAGEGPHDVIVTLGYAGWGPGQLEDELLSNAWMTVAADSRLIFEAPIEERFARAFGLLGVNPALLHRAAGHA